MSGSKSEFTKPGKSKWACTRIFALKRHFPNIFFSLEHSYVLCYYRQMICGKSFGCFSSACTHACASIDILAFCVVFVIILCFFFSSQYACIHTLSWPLAKQTNEPKINNKQTTERKLNKKKNNKYCQIHSFTETSICSLSERIFSPLLHNRLTEWMKKNNNNNHTTHSETVSSEHKSTTISTCNWSHFWYVSFCKI